MKKPATNLLIAGALAGPVYVLTSLVEILTRPGFDPTRHDWSLLSNGDWGWVHIANFLVTGILVILGAIGLSRALKGGKGGTWGPRMLGLYGLGLIGAGLSIADPMNGFPLGTPDGPPVHPTLHGLMHIVTGSLGFVGLIAACFILARYFAARSQASWRWYSLVTGVVFLLAFFGIAGGSQQKGAALQAVTLGFTAAVLLAWSWVSAMMLHVRNIKESYYEISR